MLFVFSDLFISRDGNVAVYRFDFNTNILQLRSANDGQRCQPLTPEFWMWWEETVNFVPEEHKVDFVIISDNSPSLLEIPKEYGLADGTKWSLSVIRKACESIFKDDNAEFYENGTMRFAVKNGFSNAATRFYINRFNLPKNNETKSGSNAQDGFMDYFLGDKLPDIIVKDIIH